MLNNSTWVSKDNNTTFKFSNGNTLSINGKNNSHYSLSLTGKEIVIQLGAEKSYYVNYIDDFTLCLYNHNEKYRITPE